jgi:hypothetical protein
MASTIQCAATLQTSPAGDAQCVDGTGGAVSWIAVPEFDPSLIDLTVAGEAWAVGFTMIGMSWFIGKAGQLVMNAIKRG